MKSSRMSIVIILAIFALITGGIAVAVNPCPSPELFFPGDHTYRYYNTDGQYEWYEADDAIVYNIEVYRIAMDTMTDTSDLGDLFDYAYLDTTFYDGDSLIAIYYDDAYYWCSYYWRVRSACDTIAWGNWSDFFQLKVYSKKPHLEYPENGEEYYYYQTIPIGWDFRPGETNFRVQVDNNSDFGSPEIDTVITNQSWTLPSVFSLGTHYWRVSHFYPVIWSDTNYFRIVEPPITSCPVLYSYDGREFIEENPLLTACEYSNYTRTVTDYYHLNGNIAPLYDNIVFQLRELEDEITFLEELELITVDYPQNTRIGCSVDGRVFILEGTVKPLSAVDQDGVDCLALVKEKDDAFFVADQSGHLILTFPRQNGTFLTFKGPIKLPCPGQDKASSYMTESFRVELLSEDGNWVTMPEMPPRQYSTEEYVLADIPAEISSSDISVRISWEGGFTADVFSLDVSSNTIPETRNWAVTRYNLPGSGAAAKNWSGFGTGDILELKKGDILEFGFNVDCEPPKGFSRDYIIRAVGRYQPDYSIYTHLIPGQFQLYSNRPNPFNPATVISYDLPQAAAVQLDIFNTLGQHVTTLVDKTQSPGHYEVTWDSIDKSGMTVANGIYLYRLKAGDFVNSKKMMLLK